MINQLSFRVGSLGDVCAFYQRIRDEKTASDLHPICHGHAWSIYFRDPEGNRIEVYTDTPWYVHQPVREEMDFGLPEDEIFRRSEALARSLEQLANNRLIRPRAIYTGPRDLKVIPVEQR